VNSNLFAFVRAARGPVVLVVLGVLFAVDQTGGVPFRRTWPVLLVVFGVMKLIERLLAPPLPPPPPAYYPPAPTSGGMQS
jgi:hypothetical protein